MATFTTRVELHHADEDDYEILHEAMERKGFSRLITSEKGTSYHLPTAEYNYIGSATRDAVLAAAKAAATQTKRKFAVLITESQRRTWVGLKPV